MNNNICWESLWLENYLIENGLIDRVSKFIVDCGAGDGDYCSNSKLFIQKYNWSALLIDGLQSNLDKCEKLYKEKENVFLYHALVSNTEKEVFFEENPAHWSISKIEISDKVNTFTQKLSNIVRYREIGILSLDIEGEESNVINDILSNNIFPQVIIIEGNDFQTMTDHRELLLPHYKFIGGIFPNQFFLLKGL